MNVYYNDELYVAEINSDVERYAAGVQVGVTAVGDLVEFIKDGGKRLAKILIPGRPEDSRDRIAELRQLVGSQVEIASSKPQYIEITSANTTKGRALKWLAEFFGISPAEVLAIGDGNNDGLRWRDALTGHAADLPTGTVCIGIAANRLLGLRVTAAHANQNRSQNNRRRQLPSEGENQLANPGTHRDSFVCKTRGNKQSSVAARSYSGRRFVGDRW